MKLKLAAIILMIGSISLMSCVSTKKYNDLAGRCKSENERLSSKVDELTTQVNELTAENQKLKKDNAKMKVDTTDLSSRLRVLTADYEELDRSYEMLKAQSTGNEEETQRVMAELKAAQDNLLAREDKLRALQAELDLKGKNLLELQAAIQKKEIGRAHV